jgi:hypothetical protein
MSQSDNGQALLQQDQRPLSICGSNSEAAQGFTAERVLRTRPKTYRTIVKLLADPDAKVLQLNFTASQSIRCAQSESEKLSQ